MRSLDPACRFLLALALLIGLGAVAGPPAGRSLSAGVGPQGEPPSLPEAEIVRRFAEKEDDYARAHSLYRYRLSLKIQELGDDDRVLGEFEQLAEVGFDAAGRRTARLLANPRTDLVYLGVTRVELEDLDFVPLFILSPKDIPDYDVRYLAHERLDEVDTFLFRLEPRRPVRPGERFFEGIVWVDAEKLDIVRALGRSLPPRTGGLFKGYFQRLEVYREPVDTYLFPTYARADDTLTAVGRNIRARLILRFTDHQRVGEPAPK